MPLKTDNIEDPALNLTPMIDVVFLLIIFFLVGARFTEDAEDQQFDVTLPEAAPLRTLSREPDPMVVTVRQDGGISINGQTHSSEQLQTILAESKTAWDQQAVVIRGDGDGAYQGVINVMSLCHRVGISRISLAFRPIEQEGDEQP